MAEMFIIDFDSTFIEVEALDVLAERVLAGSRDAEKIAGEIAKITNLGMEGKIEIDESLRRRLGLLDAGMDDVEALIPELKARITPSFKSNASFFQERRDDIYIMSNGFRDYVEPVVAELGVSRNHVFANDFVKQDDGRIVGFDEKNLLAQAHGKSKQLISLMNSIEPRNDIYVIGDGMTDYQMCETGLVTNFIAFVENVRREAVVAVADYTVASFDEFLELRLSSPK